MTYDFIIRNGTVIDPATNFCGKRDIYIKNGRIAQPEPNEVIEAVRELDASGCIVAPGLVDAHIHLFTSGSPLGARADVVCPCNGVTTAIDAGSAGIYNFKSFYEHDIVPSVTTIKATVSPSPSGVQEAPYDEIVDPIFGTYDRLAPLFEAYPGALVGIKQRVHHEVTGKFGLASLAQSAEVSRKLRDAGFNSRLMIHFGALPEGIALAEVLDLLDAGDVFTHIYRPNNGTTIFDEDGRVADCVKKARERGVIFESGCARVHCSFESIRKGFADGFRPDIISTDMVGYTAFWKPSGWMMLKMSIYLNAGMPIEDIVRAASYTPAKVYNLLDKAGTLEVGKPADIAVFRLEDRSFSLEDRYGSTFSGDRMCVPQATFKNGRPVFQQVYLV